MVKPDENRAKGIASLIDDTLKEVDQQSISEEEEIKNIVGFLEVREDLRTDLVNELNKRGESIPTDAGWPGIFRILRGYFLNQLQGNNIKVSKDTTWRELSEIYVKVRLNNPDVVAKKEEPGFIEGCRYELLKAFNRGKWQEEEIERREKELEKTVEKFFGLPFELAEEIFLHL